MNQKSRQWLSTVARFVQLQLRVWPACAKLLIGNRATQAAAALSYQTIFGLVPLLIVSLLVFAWFNSMVHIGFGIKDLLYKQALFNAVYRNPATGQEVKLADKLDEIVDNYLHGISAGSITIVGLVFVIWAALALLITIEMVFNDIYKVPHGRSIYQKILTYWAMLTLAPLLIGLLIYAHTLYVSDLNFEFVHYVAPIFPYLITAAGLLFLYAMIPNTQVKLTSALWGALVAALIWDIAKWGFGIYVTELIPYSAIYGILGLIPLTVLWIWVSWLIVLFGLELTYASQNITSIEQAEAQARHRPQIAFIANEITFINLMEFIWSEFSAGRAPVEFETVNQRLAAGPEFTHKILETCVSQGLLAKTSEPKEGYLPSGDARKTNTAHIADAARKAAIAQNSLVETGRASELKAEQQKIFEKYNLMD